MEAGAESPSRKSSVRSLEMVFESLSHDEISRKFKEHVIKTKEFENAGVLMILVADTYKQLA